MRIKDILSIREFEPVVDLTWGLNIDEHERMLSKYIMTDEIAETFVEILESFNMVRSKKRIENLNGDINTTAKRAHILSGQYGTGKSYFLLMLSIILEMKNSSLATKMIEHFKDFPELQYQLQYIQDRKKYFVVRINGEAQNEKEFVDVIQSTVIEAMEKEFKNLKMTAVYSSVAEILKNAYPIYSEKIDEYLEKNDDTMEDLLASLSNSSRDGLNKAREIIKDVLKLGVKVEVGTLSDFLDEVNDELKANGYNELVIIFDEFSAYITASVENKRINKDLGKIQELCQLTAKSAQKNVAFITSIHKDINTILEAYGIGIKSELDKIIGRFETHILKFEQGNELIKNTLNLDKVNFQLYKNKHEEFIDKLEKKYKHDFLDFYPIHPATIEYLTPISQIFAQKTRTTLGFIKEVVKERYFSRSVEENGKLNLVTLSDLFESFENAIDNKNPEIINIYNQNINGYPEESEVVQYLRAITIAYSSSLSKTGAKSELTAEDLKDIYQEESEEKVRENLNKLVSTNYSNVIVNNGAYRLVAGTGGIKFDKKISEEMDKISPTNVMKTILEKSESRIFIKRNYSLKYNLGFFPFDVNIDSIKLNLEELKNRNIESLVSSRGYGKLIFVVPDFHEEYNKEALIESYKELFKDVNKNICIAFVNDIAFKEKDLKEYGALLKIENTDKEVATNEEIKKIIIKRRRKLEDKIRNKFLRKFSNLKNFTFIFGEGNVETTLRSERKFFEQLLFNFYTKFPREIKVENFNTRAGINDITKMCIDRGVGEFAKNDTSSAVKQLKMLLKPLDLIEFTETVSGFKYQLKMPGEGASEISKEIMNIILDEKIELWEKYNLLQEAPYGLSEKLVDVYLFVASKTGKIVISTNRENEKEKQISLDAKTLEEVSRSPRDYKIEKNEEFLIPIEVESIWNALNSLRIVKQSKARAFKANNNNDFNPFLILSSEIKTILENLQDREKRLKARGVKTKKLKVLVDRLRELSNILKPEEFFNKMVELPNIFNKSEFNQNIEEFKSFLIKLQMLTSKIVMSYEKCSILIPHLDERIYDLTGYRDLKDKLREVDELLKYYQNDFLNVALVEKLEEKTIQLLKEYNNEYKVRHDSYHKEFAKLRGEFLEELKDKLQIIGTLKKLDLKNISSLDDFYDNLKNYEKCEVIELEDEISACKMCDKRDLKKLEGKQTSLNDLFVQYKKRVLGVYQSYDDGLRENSIKENLINSDSYKNIIFALNRVSNEETTGTEVREIETEFNMIEKEINVLLREKNLEPIRERNIEFEELTQELLLELQGTGQKYLSLEEVKNRFNSIIEKHKAQEIMSAKI